MERLVAAADHDFRDLEYRVRTVPVGQIIDASTGEVIVEGPEEEVKAAYRTLKRRAD